MAIAHAATRTGPRIAPLARSREDGALRPVPALDPIGGVVAVAVATDDDALLRRIRDALSREGVAAHVEHVGGHLRPERLGRRPGVIVLAGRDLEASLAQAGRAGRRFRGAHVVLVVHAATAPDVRRVLEAGIDGVVREADLEATLGLVVRAVCVGQVSLPRAFRHGIEAPAFSPREREILVLVVAGLSNAEIAGRLFLARSTVAGHLGNIFRRLGVHSRAEATQLILSGDESLRRSVLAVVPAPDPAPAGRR